MIDKATSAANIQSMLQTLRSYQAQASEPSAAALEGRQAPAKTGFADMVQNAVSQVNEQQVQARQMQTAYERGEPVALTDVVLGMQKSSISFEATLQIRNKVLKAYEDMLNMPV
jgi:flagellar hook-basal body complex protein FliE